MRKFGRDDWFWEPSRAVPGLERPVSPLHGRPQGLRSGSSAFRARDAAR
jgi:hypothetical protein